MTQQEIDKMFPTEADCLQFILDNKLNQTGGCTVCGCTSAALKCYEQRSCFVCPCGDFLYPRKDTVFANSKLKLKKWFYGIAIYCENPKITGQALSDMLDINYKSAYYMLKKLKAMDKEVLENFFTGGK